MTTVRNHPRFEVTTETKVDPNAYSGSLWDKWGVFGQVEVEFAKRKAAVKMVKGFGWQNPIDNLRPIPDLAERHEYGHVEFYEDLITNKPGVTAEQAQASDLWTCEVDAWVRAIEDSVTYLEGTFILDCLNTYSGLTDVEGWETARNLIEDLCDEPERLHEYEPLPPDENDNGGGRSPIILDLQPDEGDEDEKEKDDSQDDGTPDDMPDGEDSPDGEDGDGNSYESGDDESEADENDSKPPKGGGRDHAPDEYTDTDRDEWLFSVEGMETLIQGREVLNEVLWENGFKHTDLPPLIEAILAQPREVVESW